MKLTRFTGTVVVLGQEREVDFVPAYEPAEGEPGDKQASCLTIDGLTVEQAQQVVAILPLVTNDQARAALLAERTRAVEGGAQALATSMSSGGAASTPIAAVPAETEASPPKRRQRAATAPAEAAPQAADGVPPGKLRVVGAGGQVLAHGGQATTPAATSAVATAKPAADDLEESDAELDELAGTMPDWATLAVTKTMKEATKGTNVFRELVALGLDVEAMVAFCKKNQAIIPTLAGDAVALENRVRNAHRVLTTPAAT